MIQPKNETGDILLSNTKNCETLNKQTHRKAGETLEFTIIKPRESFSFKKPISIEGSWMIGLTSLEVYNSIFNITEEKNKLKLYTDSSYEISFGKLKDKVAEALGLSDISPEDLQHKMYGPDIIKTYEKLSIEKNQTDGYCI